MAVRGGKQESGRNLNTSVLSRLNKVERELKQAKECIRRKDEEIRVLRAQLDQQGGALGSKERSKAAGGSSDSQMSEYVNEMRGELAEMKAFLNDYGMVWIGGVNQRSNGANKASASSQASSNSAGRKTKEVTLQKENMSVIEKRVRELNAMIGEEEVKKQRKSGRETLTIYKDGLSFNKKPFRGFEDKSAQIVIRDLVDGYFPQELKQQYPEGVKIFLVNKIDQTYEESMKAMQIQNRPKPKQNLPSNIRQLGSLQDRDGDAEPSTENFLERVPKTVIQNGKIIQMRNDIDKMIRVDDKPVEKTAIHSLFTQKLNMADLGELEEDFSEEGEAEESDEEEVEKTVIQIKREDGMQTYVLKLPYWATIQDVKNALDTHRQGKEKSDKYVLRSAFPPQIYNDNHQTLEEAGLVPNATLFMKPT